MKKSYTIFLIASLLTVNLPAQEYFHNNVLNDSHPFSLAAGEESGTVIQKARRSFFRFGIRGGWGYRLGEVIEEAEEGMKGLKSGYGLGCEGYYHFNRFIGIGMDYAFFHASKSELLYDHDTYIHFLLPTFIFTVPIRRGNNIFSLTAALVGYTGLVEKTRQNNLTIKATGQDLASSLSIGYDFGLSRTSALGLRAAVYIASLGQATFSDGTRKEVVKFDGFREDLSTFQLTLGLRFR
jgi:hypothetical protein